MSWLALRWLRAFIPSQPITRKRPRRRRLQLEELETRLCPALYAVDHLNHVRLLAAPSGPSTPAAHKVVFYETAVADYQDLLDSTDPDTDQVLLDNSGDGLQEMAAFLANRS